MPFAPIVLPEACERYFLRYSKCCFAMEFMTITVDTNEAFAKEASAVNHVDNTARPQIVTSHNALCTHILTKFRDLTGIPVLVNTSFNMHEEPIVMTPSDAISAFLDSSIDILVMNNIALEIDDL